MSDQRLRNELYESFKNRAMIYYSVYDELRKEFGADRGRGNSRRSDLSTRKSKKGRPSSTASLPTISTGWKKPSWKGFRTQDGCSGRKSFEATPTESISNFNHCPLKDAWLEAGLPEEEVATLCRIAARIDNGTFEGAGFEFYADTWKPEGDGCCYLQHPPRSERTRSYLASLSHHGATEGTEVELFDLRLLCASLFNILPLH